VTLDDKLCNWSIVCKLICEEDPIFDHNDSNESQFITDSNDKWIFKRVLKRCKKCLLQKKTILSISVVLVVMMGHDYCSESVCLATVSHSESLQYGRNSLHGLFFNKFCLFSATLKSCHEVP
jgi:hypothetical protein